MISRWKVVAAALDATSKLLHLGLRTDGHEGDDTTATGADQGTFFAQLGVAVRPIVARTLRALVFEEADELLVLKLWDKTKLPTSLDAGETQVFACGDTSVRLRMRTTGVVIEAKGATITLTNTGAVTIAAATGQRVDLQGGTQAFIRGDEYSGALTTFLGALQTAETGIAAAIAAVDAWVAADAALNALPATPALHTALTTTLTGVMSALAGAITTFNAAQVGSLSTKIKGE